MNLDAYLARIGCSGNPRVDLTTLKEIHRQHLLSVSYENIDVQLGISGSTTTESAYNKIVLEGRGGWCYEMNGLLGWALAEIGFPVTRVCGGVARSLKGDSVLGNHLVLLTELAGSTWVVDTGFGDGIFEPIPLIEHTFNQRGFDFKLGKSEDEYWRLENHRFSGAPSFDFSTEPASEGLLSSQCNYLQKDEQSPFVLALICQRFVDYGYETQLGRVAKTIKPTGIESRLINSADELVDRLHNTFDLMVSGVAELWPGIVERHNALFTNRERFS